MLARILCRIAGMFWSASSHTTRRREAANIEFSAIILSHVIDDLTYAENGVVFPRNEDKSLENYSAIRFMQTLFVKELMII